jgi:transcriptional regulator with PAS, ATPase and Fis domain
MIIYEKQIIERTLKDFPSIRTAAKALAIDASTLTRKIQKYFKNKKIE